VRSLRARLAIGAAIIGLVAVLSSALTIRGMALMSAQVQVAVTAEKRIQRLSDLATQVGSLIVILYEAAQSGVDADTRNARLEGLTAGIRRNFAAIRADLDQNVGDVAQSDLDEQSRRATRSIGVARMEALFEGTLEQFDEASEITAPDQRTAQLQGLINAFSIGFDPLLNAAVTEDRRTREAAIAQVDALRDRLTRAAFAVGVLALLLVAGFYYFLVRPQLSRLDQLRVASRSIGNENFKVSLPDEQGDEIGLLFKATNEMAASLAARKSAVESEWGRLNQTIADRTEALRHANEALAKTDEDRRRFFADVSHELRTPLTVILMEAELALKSGAPQDGPYGVIHGRARRLNQRIDDLLRIARSDGGMLSLERTTFDLHRAAQAAVADMQSLADNAGVTITLDGVSGTNVEGDENWTRQVVTGLIENALRHAKDGGSIAININATAREANLRVIDNGPGISDEDLKVVTNRFAQASTGKAASNGFGIGLSLAHWVMTEQKGKLTIQSPVTASFKIGPNAGAMVTVSLLRASG